MQDHRNSLGYRIGHTGEAMIVEGHNADGELIRIGDAQRGAQQKLRCECGVELVAKQGDELAWHFAHASGQAGACEQATKAAAMRFIRATLLDANAISLPQEGLTTPVQSISSIDKEGYGDFPIHRVSGNPLPSLAILTKLKKKSANEIAVRARRKNMALMEVTLYSYRNLPDEELAEAIIDNAPRKWLHGGDDYIRRSYYHRPMDMSEVRRKLGF
ncbi:hypothetical protein [Qipengyuania gelatinilytica]|uniref:Uncharacterized protein n=1 Tax=Qipengyuania gelatinilytica TaxID=2867231 RepID=A0ABX9A5C3_9SPHN|nr:hypothetical protein [Qipengyuania gelatinilytica]QZD96222.1 hypothetical protein K3136_05900 [Qipengyuania gelatinilytica]